MSGSPAPCGCELATLPGDDEGWRTQSTYLGVRSRFFDECLSGAADAGVAQVVILAAGLDTWALRLDWPSGVTVYEIDQTAVLDFKDRILDQEGADVSAGRIVVPVDLRHDWPAALRAAGSPSSTSRAPSTRSPRTRSSPACRSG